VKISLVLIVLLTAAVPALAQTDSDTNGTRTTHGFAVSDGDTVKFGKQLIRLFGIDAPEKLQPCDDGKWFPGPLATDALVRIIAGRPVSCRQVDYDRKNNRPVAQCYAGDDDLQEQMVLAGWAWAYTQYSDRYVPEEKDALARKAGVHAHRYQPPWEWRAQTRATR
jgi:endonuclease YncB( thermonuclease family)